MSEISGANFCKIVGYPENYAVASKAAQNDYLLFNDPMVLIESVYMDAYGAETFVAAQLTVASIALTDTTITYSAGTGIPRSEGDYLIKVDHELFHVKGDTDEDGSTGTLTVVRGAFGTTVASHEAGTGYLQNCIKLTSVNTGDVKILYKALPMFRDGLNLSAEENRAWSLVNPNRVYGSEYTTPV
jgi:hypothetical protein